MGNFEKIESKWLKASEDIRDNNLDVLEYFYKLLGYKDGKSNIVLLTARIRDYGLAENVDADRVDKLLKLISLAGLLCNICKNGYVTDNTLNLLDESLHSDSLVALGIVTAKFLNIQDSLIEDVINGGSFVIEEVEEESTETETQQFPPFSRFLSSEEAVDVFFKDNLFSSIHNVDKESVVYSLEESSNELVYLSNEQSLATFIDLGLKYYETNKFYKQILAIILDMISRKDFNFTKPIIFVKLENCKIDGRIQIGSEASYAKSTFRSAALPAKGYNMSDLKLHFDQVDYMRGVITDKINTKAVVYLI